MLGGTFIGDVALCTRHIAEELTGVFAFVVVASLARRVLAVDQDFIHKSKKNYVSNPVNLVLHGVGNALPKEDNVALCFSRLEEDKISRV